MMSKFVYAVSEVGYPPEIKIIMATSHKDAVVRICQKYSNNEVDYEEYDNEDDFLNDLYDKCDINIGTPVDVETL